MTDREPRRLTKAEALEALAGLLLMLGAVAFWKPVVAAFAAGALLFVFAFWGRRIV